MAKDEPAPTATEKSVKSISACVNCGRPRVQRYDPFCSKRCADVDLHRWLKGAYVIPGGEPPRDDEDA